MAAGIASIRACLLYSIPDADYRLPTTDYRERRKRKGPPVKRALSSLVGPYGAVRV